MGCFLSTRISECVSTVEGNVSTSPGTQTAQELVAVRKEASSFVHDARVGSINTVALKAEREYVRLAARGVES
jgi:hypothetical protein